ncbi:hypothetical protein C4J93_0640 [Pseudomonas sp. R2-37-08W]|nr:hypothetical protein C4J93_0640 [Pseudomonas sp. R2-37-08W]
MERHCTRPPSTPQCQCGRGLAPECGISVDESVPDPPPSGASPLPHFLISIDCGIGLGPPSVGQCDRRHNGLAGADI